MTNKHASSRYQEDPRIFCLQKLTSSCRQCLHSCSEVKQTSIRLRSSSSALTLQEVTTIIDMTRMMRRNAWTVKKRKKKKKDILVHPLRSVASRRLAGDHGRSSAPGEHVWRTSCARRMYDGEPRSALLHRHARASASVSVVPASSSSSLSRSAKWRRCVATRVRTMTAAADGGGGDGGGSDSTQSCSRNAVAATARRGTTFA